MGEAVPSDCARLTVRRPDGGWTDRLRSYDIVVDGVVAGRVKRGQSTTLELSPGPHEIRGELDWAGSPSVHLDVTAGQDVSLVLRANANPLLGPYWATVGRNRYLALESDAGPGVSRVPAAAWPRGAVLLSLAWFVGIGVLPLVVLEVLDVPLGIFLVVLWAVAAASLAGLMVRRRRRR